jgi:hypothetical protein
MGCTASTDTQTYLRQINDLQNQLEQQRVKAHEQQNLLRFKVEVLVNMLAVEEKRSDENTKRIETMQWMLAKEGITEDSLNELLLGLDDKEKAKFHSTISDSKISEKILMPDVGTVVEKMRDEFSTNKDDILHAFSRNDGKVVSSLSSDSFVRQICETTQHLSPTDARVLALRFDDGTGGMVSVTEFMDFFLTPPSVRTARSAASAVRMSLDLFSLNVELLDNINNDKITSLISEEEIDQLPQELRATHYTDILNRGVKRLLVMWIFVRDELRKQLAHFAKKNEIEKVIEIEIFQV